MRGRALLLAGMLGLTVRAQAQTACRRAVIEGEVKAGEGFSRRIGNGLTLGLEPLASGWILRVVPSAGPRGEHDYAELATPPYESINPLLISTDFSFRAQDAVGWNPRRFRFASDAVSFAGLRESYLLLRGSGPHTFGQPFTGTGTPAQKQLVEQRLAHQIGETTEGTFQIVDARLVAGTADQASGAASVASHFEVTAHVAEQPPDGMSTPLGKLLWLKFRISFDPPAGFQLDAGIPARPCTANGR